MLFSNPSKPGGRKKESHPKAALLGYKVLVAGLEAIADAQTEAGGGETTVQEIEGRSPVERQGQRNLEVVFQTDHAGSTYVQTRLGGTSVVFVVVETNGGTGAGIEIEITFAGENKVVDTGGIETMVEEETSVEFQEVLTHQMLIRNFGTVADAKTDRTGLSHHDSSQAENGDKNK